MKGFDILVLAERIQRNRILDVEMQSKNLSSSRKQRSPSDLFFF